MLKFTRRPNDEIEEFDDEEFDDEDFDDDEE